MTIDEASPAIARDLPGRCGTRRHPQAGGNKPVQTNARGIDGAAEAPAPSVSLQRSLKSSQRKASKSTSYGSPRTRGIRSRQPL